MTPLFVKCLKRLTRRTSGAHILPCFWPALHGHPSVQKWKWKRGYERPLLKTWRKRYGHPIAQTWCRGRPHLTNATEDLFRLEHVEHYPWFVSQPKHYMIRKQRKYVYLEYANGWGWTDAFISTTSMFFGNGNDVHIFVRNLALSSIDHDTLSKYMSQALESILTVQAFIFSAFNYGFAITSFWSFGFPYRLLTEYAVQCPATLFMSTDNHFLMSHVCKKNDQEDLRNAYVLKFA